MDNTRGFSPLFIEAILCYRKYRLARKIKLLFELKKKKKAGNYCIRNPAAVATEDSVLKRGVVRAVETLAS